MELRGITLLREDDQHVWLNVAAGENWHQFVLYCLQQQYFGIENLSLIPGTVGAAPIQNIGAYGVELKEMVTEISGFTLPTGEVKTFSHPDCEFGYRDSIFKRQWKNKFIITDVTFKLSKKPTLHMGYGDIQQTLVALHLTPSCKAISETIIHIRQKKLPDPKKIGNAGSFFKNPTLTIVTFEKLKKTYPTIPHYPAEKNTIKIPAAWLIEQCGYKGLRRVNIGVHENQALVLVNYGKGTGTAILALAEEIQQQVYAKFNIRLAMEVNLV
jgi:UDP-N-acetylmuramate dehydrogenase